MTQFHEGQDVEVHVLVDPFKTVREWRKAKIVGRTASSRYEPHRYFYQVEFPDRPRAVFHAEHIMAVEHVGVASGRPTGDYGISFDASEPGEQTPVDHSDSDPSDYECADGSNQ